MRVASLARTGALAALVVALLGSPVGVLVASAQDPTPATTAGASPGPEGSPRPAELTMFTTYPSVVADPGDEARFPLTVGGPAPERVDLEATDVPEGFEPSFRGGGSIVRSVHTGGEEPPDLELRVSVPDSAMPGVHEVVITATAPSGSVRLPLDIVVADVSEGSVTLGADFPALRGDSEDTFSFDLDLENDTSQDIDFGLEAEGPPGWQVTVRPSTEEQAATTQVAAGDSERIRATVRPAFRADAGVYPIIVRATGGDRQAEALLSVEITGTYELELTTPDGRLNTSVTAGGSTDLALVVVNTGTAPLTDVSLDADAPQGWEVAFTPEEIPALAAGGTQDVVAAIAPVGNAVAGDYIVTLSAGSADADDEVTVRTTVETSTLWGVVGLGLIILVLVGLAFVFRRFGRR
jgi:uncharacterized membrane protein